MAKKSILKGKQDPLSWMERGQEIQSNTSKQSRQSNTSKPTAKTRDTSTTAGLPEGWTRATFVVRADLLHQIKALAYWERRTIKEVIAECMEAHLAAKQKEVRKGLKIYAKG